MKTLLRVAAVVTAGVATTATALFLAGPALAEEAAGRTADRPAPDTGRVVQAKLSSDGAVARATDQTVCSGYAGYSSAVSYRTCLTVRGKMVAYNIQWVNRGAAITLRNFLQMANNGKFLNDPGYYNVLVRVPTTPSGQFAYVGRTWTVKAAVNTTWAAVGRCATPNNASSAARVVSPTLRVTA